MSTKASQPTLGRALSVLWFPVVLAGLFSTLLLTSFTDPQPHSVTLGVVAAPARADALAGRLDRIYPGGFRTTPYASRTAATAAVEDQAVAAAVVDTGGAPEILVATASSNQRASYLSQVLPPVLADEGWGTRPQVVDVVPRESDDAIGNAVFFWGISLLVTGLITSILLLQLAAWSTRRKAAAIGVVGALASLAVFAVAAGLDVLPAEPLLLVYGFLLTQAVAWVTTGLAPFVKQFFVPVAVTFVLVLGIPSAGGTVAADLLPGVSRWLSSFMPLAQTISLGRAAAYFDGHGTLRPLLVMLAWVVLGALAMAAAELRARAQHRSVAAGLAAEAADVPAGSGETANHVLTGTVHTTGGRPVPGATLIAVDRSGGHQRTVAADADGNYRMDGLRAGPLHVAVVAPHTEPEIATVVVHRRQGVLHHDVVLVDWEEAAAAAAVSH